MIEAILMKLGISGIIASVSLASLFGFVAYHKMYRARQAAIIETKTSQIQALAAERAALMNANRAYTQTITSQNSSIENLIALGKVQREKTEEAKREAEKVKESWERFIEHLDTTSPSGGDRWALYGDTYGGIQKKWNRSDLDSGNDQP